MCNTCKENAFQCHSCRNINYDHLDAFLCNECGLSKYITYSFQICARPDFAVEKITNDKMKDDAEKNLEDVLVQAQKKYSKLNERKQSLTASIKLLNSSEISVPISDIQKIFNDSAVLYQDMMKNMENAKSLRKELIEFEEVKRGEYSSDNQNSFDDIFKEPDEKADEAMSKEYEQEDMSD